MLDKIKTEHFIIAFLVVLLLLDGCQGEKKPDTVIETKITEKIITEVDSSSNSAIKDRKPEKVSVIENRDHVEVVPEPEKLSPEEKEKVKPAFRYQDTTHFDNATIYSDILSEGRILKLDLKTSIDHLERTIETTKQTTRQAGGFFVSPAISYTPMFGIEDISGGLTYIKGNFGATVSGYYNFRPFIAQMEFHQRNPFGVRVQIHIKL
ncbi:hypothetical protein RM549_06260 [Salegentibacter sp. F188]|uniref:Lipoprotein n=1 Tax=Autumnicola patrickiae TaxID=3075591 RepID=A0ABU3E072_9FLAO|nr:hypothetical protein [Salegentibacter sp. F188]MDT0689381.1 hypothetical protein [Salegentibacter sp. F188]